MTTATPTTTSQAVHSVMPQFHALWEGAVNWSACGPVANEVAVAALQGRTPDPDNAKAVVARDAAAGRFHQPGGQNLSDIAWDLNERGFKQLAVVPYSATPDLNAIHALLKEGGLNKWPVILQVSRAYNLPDNEAGVRYHFVVSGGIDSTLGYLLANGDTKTGIALQPQWPASTHIPLNWASWSVIENAGVCGAILVHPADWTPPPPPAPADPDEADEAAKLAALKSQIAQVQTLVASIQEALTAF